MAGPILDFSKGDPLRPFKAVARHAFRSAAENLNRYRPMQSPLADPWAPVLRDLTGYFNERGLLRGAHIAAGAHVLPTGGGTTEAYELIIRMLAADIRAREAESGEALRPVIVMPVPTYGFFFKSPREWGIEPVFIEREEDGSLDPAKLAALLAKLESEGRHAAAFYDSNPNNPTGRIRGPEDTAALAQVMMEHAAAQGKRNEALDYRLLDAAKARGASDKELMSLTFWQGPASRIRIIDDMVYDGLEYAGQPKAFGFAQVKENAWGDPADMCFTIMGPSKAGLVSLRAGIIVATRNIITLRNTQLSTSYSAADTALHALHAYYSNKPPFARQREEHLRRLNAAHRFRGQLMKALIDGFDAVPELTEKEKARMVRLLARADNIPPGEARARLERGIEGIRVLTAPQSGFFHLIDFSGLRGRAYQFTPRTIWGKDLETKTHIFSDCEDVKRTFGIAGLGFAYADWTGLDPARPVVRATFAETPQNIIAFANRLEEVTKTLAPAAPPVLCPEAVNRINSGP